MTVASLILFHGVDKVINGIAWMQPPLAALHLPAWVAYGVFIGEIVAPLFLLAGVAARLAALVICVNMVMAVVLDAHVLAFTIDRGGGWGLEREAFYFLCAAAAACLGPGRFRIAPGKKKASAATAAPQST